MDKKKLIRVLLSTIIIVLILVIFPTYTGLAKGGFADEGILFQYFFYIGQGIGYLVGLLAIFVLAQTIIKGDNKYGDSVYFVSQGEGVSPPFWKRFTTPQLFIGFLFIFSLAALYFVVSQQVTFTGVGQLQQQFTATDNLIYSNTLVPIAENLGAMFLGAVIIVLLRMLARKLDWSKGLYLGISSLTYVASFVIYAVGLHFLRYGSSEAQIGVVAMFWLVGGLLTIFTGSYAPFWAMHIANNLFVGLRTYFQSETAVSYSFAIIIALGIIYGVVYGNRLLGGRVE